MIYNYEYKYLTPGMKHEMLFNRVLHLNELSLFPFNNKVYSQKVNQKNSDSGSFAGTACRPKGIVIWWEKRREKKCDQLSVLATET